MIDFLVHYRATIGTLGTAVLIFFSDPTPRSVTIGFFLMILGAAFRAWTSGYINKNNELATDGPYSLTRNPLYFANTIIGAGIAVSGNNWLSLVIATTYCLFFFPMLIIVEHRLLKKTFGEAYTKWANEVNIFVPKIRRVKHPAFDISLYMRNREYRVFYLTLLITAIMVLKVLKIIRSL